MASVRRRNRPGTPHSLEQVVHGQPARLPMRWAVIGILAFAAGLVGFMAGGPVAAITTFAAVAMAAHKLID